MKRKPKPTPKPPAAHPPPTGGAGVTAAGKLRRRGFRLAAALVVPFGLLALTELVLRLAGYGFDPGFFKPLKRDGTSFLVENDRFGWRFFPPAVARAPAPVVMPATKAPGTFRIFILGESAALGDPRPAYGFGRYLEVLLRERFPEARFEVVNVGMTAVSSHVIREIARDCARQDGDLWVVYMGNNEYYGPFGAGTVFGPQAPAVGWVRTQLALKSTRLGQWLASLAAGAGGGDGAPTNWAGLRMFAGHELAPDDPRRDAVERNFTANLDAIVASGVGSGARVLVSSVASNLRECGPFASRHATTMPAAEQAEWGALFQTAVSLADSGEAGAALPLLHTAVTESPAHAEAQFRLAEQELTGPDATAAVVRFGQARDADAMPFRADSRLNGAARRVATQWAARGVEWVDAVEVLARSAPDGVPGGESFHEHVHLNFDGNYRLARMFADQVAPGLPGAVTNRAAAAWATQEVCERRLGLTDWNRSAVLESMLGRVVEAPYTSQLHADDRLQRIRAELGRAREGLDPSTRAEAPSLYEDAIRRAPQDHRLHENYAEFLEATGDVPAAMAEWTRVRALIPHHLSGWYQSGRLYARLRQPAEARAALEQALRLRPDLAEALVELATVEAAEGNLDVALQRCDAALRMRPGEARIHVQRADVLARMKRRDDAVASLREAVRVQPGYWDAHYLLGVELAVDEKLKEAEAEFAEVVRLRPDHILGRVNLGVSLAKQARFDEAEVQFNEVLRLDPVNARALQAMEMIKTLRARTAAPGLGPLR